MEVKGEAGCAMDIQPVTAEGEQGAGGKHLHETWQTTSLSLDKVNESPPTLLDANKAVVHL